MNTRLASILASIVCLAVGGVESASATPVAAAPSKAVVVKAAYNAYLKTTILVDGSVPQELVGCWHRHVPTLPTGVPAGVWSIAIKRRGPLAAFLPGSTSCGASADWTAPLSVVANRLTIGPTSNAICPSNGVYRWRLSGNSLTLAAVKDKACGGIRLELFVGVWKRK